MRRSAAPSRVGSNITTGVPPKLNDVVRNNPHQISVVSCVSSRSEPNALELKIFEAVYAKTSSCKHKKWKNDGFVLIHGRTARLMDSKGKYVASNPGNKVTYLNSLCEGSLLKVGGYEAELLNLVSPDFYQAACGAILDDYTGTSTMSQKDVFPVVPHNSTCTSSARSSVSPLTRSSLKPHRGAIVLPLQQQEDALVMPRPPAECVWVQNPEGFPIVDVVLEPQFARRLLPHQRHGVVFLYECVMGFRSVHASDNSILTTLTDPASREMPDSPVTGCILADEMGLGKTVQAIALLWLLLRQGPYGGFPVIRRCLLVTPSTLVQNWVNEFSKWLGRERLPVYCVNQNTTVKNYTSLSGDPPPVLIMSYEMFLSHAQEVRAIPHIDMVICDEGHRLKNANISTYSALQQLPARRRVLLTGTPVQNNLDELWSLAEFCAPGRLAHSQEAFRREFRLLHHSVLTPFSGAEESDSHESAVFQEKLSDLLATFLLRRTTDVLRSSLTAKHEFVVFCRPSPLQTQLECILYKWVQQELSKGTNLTATPYDFSDDDGDDSRDTPDGFPVMTESILCAITAFRKLYNHPALLKRFLQPQESSNFATARRTRCRLPSKLTDELLDYLASYNGVNSRADDTNFETAASTAVYSAKLTVLVHMLNQLFAQSVSNSLVKPRLVLVSNFTQTLDLLETVCTRLLRRPPLRLDGKTPSKRRTEIVQRFNELRSDERILLLSSRAGGTGLNLIGANYLILFDMDWNPANDAQAMARIWRPGQSRPVRLYRLVTAGGLEERIFQRQAAKLALSHQTLTNPANSGRFNCSQSSSKSVLTREELHDLFQTPSLRGDRCWTHVLIGCTCDVSLPSSPSPTLSTGSTRSVESSEQHRSEDDESEIRTCQLGRNPIEFNTNKRNSTSLKVSQTFISESLAFLLNWKHSLNDVAIGRLGDPLLSNFESYKENLPITAVFSLDTEEPENVQTVAMADVV